MSQQSPANDNLVDAPQQPARSSRWDKAEEIATKMISMPLWLLVVIVALCLLTGGVFVSERGDDSKSTPAAIGQQTAVAPASEPAASTPEPSPKEAWASPFRQVTGFDSPEGKAYVCSDDLTPVQLTMGQVYKREGTTLSLSENVTAQSKNIPFYPSPQQVSLSVKLDANHALPGYIVQTTWQAQFPTINNQVTFNASLGKGGETVYTLTEDSLPYHDGGNKVVGATVCLK